MKKLFIFCGIAICISPIDATVTQQPPILPIARQPRPAPAPQPPPNITYNWFVANTLQHPVNVEITATTGILNLRGLPPRSRQWRTVQLPENTHVAQVRAWYINAANIRVALSPFTPQNGSVPFNRFAISLINGQIVPIGYPTRVAHT